MIQLQNAELLELENLRDAIQGAAESAHAALTRAAEARRAAAGAGGVPFHATMVEIAAQVAYDDIFDIYKELTEQIDAASHAAACAAAREEAKTMTPAEIATNWLAGDREHAGLIALVLDNDADVVEVHTELHRQGWGHGPR